MKRILSILLLSLFAAVAMAGTEVYTPILKAPVSLSINQMPNVIITWNAIVGSTSLQYEIQIDTSANFNSSLLKDTIQTLLTGYTTHNLLFGSVYYWRVRAIDLGQTSQWSSIWSFTVFGTLELSKPLINDTTLSPDASIAWNSTVGSKTITGVNYYDYEIDTSMTFNSPLYIHGTTNSNTFTYTNSNLRFGTMYYWRVKARHSGGSSGIPVVWTKQKSNTNNDIYGIFMLDALKGYAVGSAGTIINTVDGGNTWTSQNSGVAKKLSSVWLNSASTGFAVGDSGIILKTNGSSWTKYLPSITGSNLNSIAFSHKTPSVGYAVGDNGIILKTKTTGTKWYNKVSGTTNRLTSISIPSDSAGFIVGNGGIILKTTNTDTTWKALISGTTTDLNGVFFVTSKLGYAVGKSGKIIKTSNSGLTWNNLPSGTSNDLYSVLFTDSQRGYVVGANGTILKTNNGGLNWISLNSSITGGVLALSFATSTNGYICGSQGQIIATTTGGTPWSFKVVNNLTLTSPANKSTDQSINALLKWNTISGILGYEYQIATDTLFNELVVSSDIDTNFVNSQFTKFGQKYYWRVRARTVSDTSIWSVRFGFTTIDLVKLIAPSNSSTNIAIKPTMKWTKQTGIVKYQLQVNQNPDFTPVFIDVKLADTLTSYVLTNKLNYNAKYYWRMRAISDSYVPDTSGWSDLWSFTTLINGIAENGVLSSNLYPNPASGKVNIKMDVAEPLTLQVTVIDLLGSTFIREEFELSSGTNVREINLANLSKGIYIVRLSYDGTVVNHKLIVDR